ncbi:hypothetical protein [Ktedonospora formicarum]|uniref:hypothetical protein n=1 Tax=Ktedonospora formicarum TaxID=2778364 RepID=UPI003B75B50E
MAHGATKRIHLEGLPSYTPELNALLGVWNLLKRRELKNACCQTLQQRDRELLLARARLRHRRSILHQCFTHTLGNV